MARDLYYARIPYDYARDIKWDEVMENDWDSARWNTNQNEVMVHWVGKTPPGLQKILDLLKQNPQPHFVENNYIKKTEDGKNQWELRPMPPKKPKGKK